MRVIMFDFVSQDLGYGVKDFTTDLGIASLLPRSPN